MSKLIEAIADREYLVANSLLEERIEAIKAAKLLEVKQTIDISEKAVSDDMKADYNSKIGKIPNWIPGAKKIKRAAARDLIAKGRKDPSMYGSPTKALKKDNHSTTDQKIAAGYRKASAVWGDPADQSKEMVAQAAKDKEAEQVRRDYLVQYRKRKMAQWSSGKDKPTVGGSIVGGAAKGLWRGLQNAKEEFELDETLGKNAKAGTWIHDFVHSKNKTFKGHSKKLRIKQALAAYYSKQGEK